MFDMNFKIGYAIIFDKSFRFVPVYWMSGHHNSVSYNECHLAHEIAFCG